jgi:hypothetical protein
MPKRGSASEAERRLFRVSAAVTTKSLTRGTRVYFWAEWRTTTDRCPKSPRPSAACPSSPPSARRRASRDFSCVAGASRGSVRARRRFEPAPRPPRVLRSERVAPASILARSSIRHDVDDDSAALKSFAALPTKASAARARLKTTSRFDYPHDLREHINQSPKDNSRSHNRGEGDAMSVRCDRAELRERRHLSKDRMIARK